jgi:hypothetical protein
MATVAIWVRHGETGHLAAACPSQQGESPSMATWLNCFRSTRGDPAPEQTTCRVPPAQLEALPVFSNRRRESDSPQNHYNVPQVFAASGGVTRATHMPSAGCRVPAAANV